MTDREALFYLRGWLMGSADHASNRAAGEAKGLLRNTLEGKSAAFQEAISFIDATIEDLHDD